MKTPGDYKRNYHFKSDTSKEKRYFNISIIVSIIILIVVWLLIN
ncbi:MAG: hypothetical protein REI78_13870 [Pedobacter sp.]|nr:hypothetical protein [Pedobacter sp.]